MKKTDLMSPVIATEFLLPVAAEHACYADHFPGNPLVPGALLLKWIVARIEVECNCTVAHLKSIKFLAPVKPGDNLKMIVNAKSILQLSFEIYVSDTLVIKGSIACIEQLND